MIGCWKHCFLAANAGLWMGTYQLQEIAWNLDLSRVEVEWNLPCHRTSCCFVFKICPHPCSRENVFKRGQTTNLINFIMKVHVNLKINWKKKMWTLFLCYVTYFMIRFIEWELTLPLHLFFQLILHSVANLATGQIQFPNSFFYGTVIWPQTSTPYSFRRAGVV